MTKWKIQGDDRIRGKDGKPFDPKIIKYSRPEKKKVTINIYVDNTVPTGPVCKLIPIDNNYPYAGRCVLLPEITIE